jgi:acylphosphatase
VEVLACGEAAAVEQLRDWLWQGPAAAGVTDVECRRIEVPAPARFSTG